MEISRLPLLWGVAGVLLAVGLAIGLALRQLPTRAAVRALLDKQSGCGGLLMAAEDTDLGDWQKQMPSMSLPRLHWRSGRSWTLFTISTLFVIASFLVPWRFAAVNPSYPLEIHPEVGKLAVQIETLEKEKILEPPRAESLREKLDQVSAKASGEDPAKTWEALDHLEDTLSKVAKEAAEEALRAVERLTQMQTLAEGLMETVEEINPKLMAEVMQELSKRMQEEAAKNLQLSALSHQLSKQTLNAL
ncbi:MAG: hypothetical protein L0Y56_05300, partial [Nitrospira sp.]|nr:hypothetical protein [Nitrospira sp.]